MLPTERLLTSSLTVTGPRVEGRFGAQDEVVEWRSELTPQAALVLAADIAVRIVLPGRDLKLGVLMALVGAPVFLHLIWRLRGTEA